MKKNIFFVDFFFFFFLVFFLVEIHNEGAIGFQLHQRNYRRRQNGHGK